MLEYLPHYIHTNQCLSTKQTKNDQQKIKLTTKQQQKQQLSQSSKSNEGSDEATTSINNNSQSLWPEVMAEAGDQCQGYGEEEWEFITLANFFV